MTSDPFHMFMTCATPQRQVTRHQSFGGCKGCRVVNCWYCYMSCLMGTMKPIVPLTNPEHMHYPNVNFAMLCCSWCAWRHKPHWVRAAGSSSGLGYWVADPTSSSARQGHVWWHQPSGCPSYGKNTPVSCLAHIYFTWGCRGSSGSSLASTRSFVRPEQFIDILVRHTQIVFAQQKCSINISCLPSWPYGRGCSPPPPPLVPLLLLPFLPHFIMLHLLFLSSLESYMVKNWK